MISLDEVLKIHSILIEKFGGSTGVRDKDLLNSSHINTSLISLTNVYLLYQEIGCTCTATT